VGGVLMSGALLVFAAGVAASMFPSRSASSEPGGMSVGWGGAELRPGATAWVGPVSVLAIVAAMYVFTIVGFEWMRSLPITAAGGAAH
jgi:cytochrome c oxidase subunit I